MRDLGNADELARLQKIVDLGLAYGMPNDDLDALAKEAAEEIGLPVGLVTIIMADVQHWPGMHGLTGHWSEDARGTPVEWSWCQYVVDEKKTFVVEDSASIPHMPAAEASPLVKMDGLKCYLGVPLVSDGQYLGSFCVTGFEERTFSDEDHAKMHAFAERAMKIIEQVKEG